MRTASLLRRLPWLVSLLAGCADDIGGDGDDDSTGGGSTGAMSTSTSTSMAMTVTGADDSTTEEDEDSSDSDSTGAGDSTGSPNTTPQAVDDLYFTPQDNGLVVDAGDGVFANDTDPDGDPLTLVEADVASVAGGAVLVGADGALDYTPAEGYWGPDSFQYTVQDDAGETASATAILYVTPVRIPLGDVTAGAGGFVLDGEAVDDQSGRVVSGAGDVNGDGMDDLIVGAYGSDPNGPSSGRTYVVFGRAETTGVQLSDVTAGVGGFALDGEAELDFSGISVSGAGDVNGDGMDDIIVGATGADTTGTSSGRSYVVFGKADTIAVQLSDVAAGVGGFALDGEGQADFSGRSVSGVGDFNGDGMDDFIIGADGAGGEGTNTGPGRTYFVFGKADTTAVSLSDVTAGVGGFMLEGEGPFVDFSGHSVSATGDVNGDGLDDLIIGAGQASPNGARSGRSYVVFGKIETTEVQLSDVAAGLGGYALDGEAAGDWSGYSVSGAGDVNGDGMGDFILGARGADPNGSYSGRSYVVFGKADTTAVQLSDVAAGVGGFILDGEAADDQSGRWVSGAGDLNGDGMGDLIVGAYLADPVGLDSGRTYVIFGKADTEAVQLSDVAVGTGGFVLDGEAADDQSGRAVSGPGDVNGDGMNDIIVGARFADANGDNSGRSYVVFGVPTVARAGRRVSASQD